MSPATNDSRLQHVMLDTIQTKAGKEYKSFSADEVMREVVTTLKGSGRADDVLKWKVLSYFNDLVRTGVVGLGNVKSVGEIPDGGRWLNGSVHVTPEGEKVLEHASRDPINQPGYLAYLEQEAPIDNVTRGYVEEALNTYRACCYKATAILIGAAIENLTMILRDKLRGQLAAGGLNPPKGLTEWKAKTVLEAIADKVIPDLAAEAKKNPGDEELRNLSEASAARLRPAAAEFRKTRNDAGHPASLDPVNPADVHANLLLFPSTANLLRRLTEWVADYYS